MPRLPLRKRWADRPQSTNVEDVRTVWSRALTHMTSPRPEEAFLSAKPLPYDIGVFRNIGPLAGVNAMDEALARDRTRLQRLQNPEVDEVFRFGGRWDAGEEIIDEFIDRKLNEIREGRRAPADIHEAIEAYPDDPLNASAALTLSLFFGPAPQQAERMR